MAVEAPPDGQSSPEEAGASREGRDDSGRFAAGNRFGPGRPKGARNRLSEQFLSDLEETWRSSGKDVLKKLAADKPGIFARIVAGLEPKRLEVKDAPFSAYSDEELAEILEDLRGPTEGTDHEA